MRPKDSEENNWGFGNEDLVNTTAGRMYGHHVDLVRKELASYDVQAERLRKTFAAARAEADRSTAILLFAMVEDVMLHALKRHLHGEVAGGWKDLSSGNELLATANDRMTLLALLGWIHPLTYADVRIMKSIRNLFAHHPDVIDFEDNKIRGLTSSLFPREKVALSIIETDIHLTARQTYLVRASGTLMQLVYNLAYAPAARRERVSPEHVNHQEWEKTPDNIRELHRLMAEHVLAVCR